MGLEDPTTRKLIGRINQSSPVQCRAESWPGLQGSRALESRPVVMVALVLLSGSTHLLHLWGHSSVGRAPALHAGCQGFDSPCFHSFV